MSKSEGADRRDFLKTLGLAGAAALPAHAEADAQPQPVASGNIAYPRSFTGPALKMISFPLG
ncbi:MAG: twin-arginine translocation signal domain-containing protein, partial [Bryobacteraceae bacterium]